MESFKTEQLTLDMLNSKYRLYFSFIRTHTKPISENVDDHTDSSLLHRYFKVWKDENNHTKLSPLVLDRCIQAVYGRSRYQIIGD